MTQLTRMRKSRILPSGSFSKGRIGIAVQNSLKVFGKSTMMLRGTSNGFLKSCSRCKITDKEVPIK
jgi:hypothetical protein